MMNLCRFNIFRSKKTNNSTHFTVSKAVNRGGGSFTRSGYLIFLLEWAKLPDQLSQCTDRHQMNWPTKRRRDHVFTPTPPLISRDRNLLSEQPLKFVFITNLQVCIKLKILLFYFHSTELIQLVFRIKKKICKNADF